MKRFIQGELRGQGTLLPENLDDYVNDTNPVRVVDIFVDELDSAKESFQCPNDECRAGFDALNVLGPFNAKNVNYIRTPHFNNLPSTRHVEGCPCDGSDVALNKTLFIRWSLYAYGA